MSDDTYLVEGSMKLDDINDALGTDLTSEDYDSIGGLIIDCLDRLRRTVRKSPWKTVFI